MSGMLGNNGGRTYSFGSQPVLIDCNFVVTPTNGLGITSLQGQGIENVFMHTSTTPTRGPNGLLNPNPAAGYAWIQLSNNYNRYLGEFNGVVSPLSGSNIAIDSTTAGLTAGSPYVITGVGAGPAGQATIQPVADSSGSLASTYFMLYDSYGNAFCIWFSVSGVGSAPNLGAAAAFGQRGLHYIQQSILTGATAAQIGAALVITINALQSGISGLLSFTSSGTTTVTVVSTALQPLAGIPQDGNQVIAASNSQPVPIWFTISSGSATAGSVWTDGFGNLYTVATTLVAGTLLKTTGVQAPGAASGNLTYVSGSGATTTLAYSSAVAGLATGFTFALTVSDTNLQDWVAVGVPAGVTPAVGVSFIAKATGAGGSTGTVKVPGTSGISDVEIIGDPNVSFAPQPTGPSAHVGGWVLVQFLAPTSASVTTRVATAPTTASKVYISFYVDAKFSPSNIGL